MLCSPNTPDIVMTNLPIVLTGFEAETAQQLATQLAALGVTCTQETPKQEHGDSLLLVDVDTLGGHMAWLKLRAAGHAVVACSTQPVRGEGMPTLALPASEAALRELLQGFAQQAAAPAAPTRIATATAPAGPAPVAANDAPAPRVCDLLLGAAAPSAWQFAHDDTLLRLDPRNDAWYGPTQLKALRELLLQPAHRAAVAAAALTQPVEAGGPQPLARLRWYAALVAAPGTLPEGAEADSRLHLKRWPEIEREFPRHFRIAAALMRHPATLAEIAAQTGSDAADVADFARAAQARGLLSVLPPAAADAQPMPAARR